MRGARRISAAALAALALGAHAQGGDPAADYPNRPIRIIVGFTPGGGPDITARYVAQKLTESWKQQVLVENRPGAGGTVAANFVATAGPDGYTLLSVSSAHAVAGDLRKLPYDTRRTSPASRSRRRRNTCWWCRRRSVRRACRS
jgi:tripartite-type tricarboxylate transporter receptor subunit TctC